MKLAGRQVRFLVPLLPTFRPPPVRLVGNDNSIQLLETAIVLEGSSAEIVDAVGRFFVYRCTE